MTRIPLTHKGWFGPCPVYSAGNYDGRPLFIERHWSLTPLMLFAQFAFTLALIAHVLARPDREPVIPITITGRMEPGRSIELPLVE